MRILFVDDEPMLLDAMQRLFRAKHPEWEVACAPGGDAALALETAAFDVVVSDMRMPGLDGAQLLQRVRRRQPHAVRVILSGFADEEASFRAAGVAHRCVVKPCSVAALEDVIKQAEALHHVLRDPALRSLLGSVDSLPPAPATYLRLTHLLGEPGAGLSQIAGVVAEDGAIAAKLLQLVHSAFFGISHPVTDMTAAIQILGIRTVRALVLGYEVIQCLAGDVDPAGFSLTSPQQHALQVAALARRMARAGLEESAFLAGLLHDAGKLVLATRCAPTFAADQRLAAAEGLPLHVIEQQRRGYTHAQVGAYLFGLWGLPGGVVKAVANHHAPTARGPAGEPDVAGIIHLADALVHERTDGSGFRSRIDLGYVEAAGLVDRLAVWRAQAVGLAA
jgi:HD-like signal output (HDOD) protein/ActR/RegA family two-component response regulator